MDVAVLKINESSYNIKDQTARTAAESAETKATSAETKATSAETLAKQGFKVEYSAETLTFTSLGGV